MDTFKKYLICIIIEFLFSGTSSYSQVVPDKSTGTECLKTCSTENSKIVINGGVISKTNLFHSFSDFNVSEGQSVYFNNPSGILNIISRVTGSNESFILGKLGVLGKANLFFINPNGIIFGPNSSLDLHGSFLGTTADSIQFDNQGFFDASSLKTPQLLTVTPSALVFNRNNFSSIVNTSKFMSSPTSSKLGQQFGLSVDGGNNLFLIAGNISLKNGGIYTSGGSVELGGVVGPGTIQINEKLGNIRLSYPNNIVYGNISLTNGSVINASGDQGGNIYLTGKNIDINNSSQVISNTTDSPDSGTLSISATESVRLIDFTSGGILSTSNYSPGNAGNIKIMAKNLLIKDGAQVLSTSLDSGNGGNISVKTSESVEITGFINLSKGGNIFITTPSYISSLAVLEGNGGDISIITPNLLVSNFAYITTGSRSLFSSSNGNTGFTSSTGKGGQVKIITENSTILNGGSISVGTQGNITENLTFPNSGSFYLSTGGNGSAGVLEIDSHSILLENNSNLSATGKDGNIKLSANDIILRNISDITTDASGASGGKINISSGVLIALGNSDITANSFDKFGGQITIASQKIFGTKYRKELTPESDITASSKLGPNFSGNVEINITGVDPNHGITQLPATIIDSSSLLAENPCNHFRGSEFTRSGRGGLPPSLSQDFDSESSQVSLVQPIKYRVKKPHSKSVKKVEDSLLSPPLDILPAQGWLYNNEGKVVLVVNNPYISGQQRAKSKSVSCSVF